MDKTNNRPWAPVRTDKPLTVFLSPDLGEWLAEAPKRNSRTKTVQVVLALERFLPEDEKPAARRPGGRGKGK
jgi:hypothetical protein